VIRLLCLHLLRLQLRLRFPPALGDIVEADLGDIVDGDIVEAAFEPRSTIFINSKLYLKLLPK
jgi:hypothetical protein